MNAPNLPFKVQAQTPERVASRIMEIRGHFSKKIEVIQEIQDNHLQLLCLFALIESMAQEFANYSACSEQKKFTDFILAFQNKWDFLDKTDPITLFYDVQEQLDSTINLNFMVNGGLYAPSWVIKRGMTKEILNCLRLNNVKNLDRLERKHRYADLLYKMRSKLSHELAVPGQVLRCLKAEEPLPYFLSCTRIYDIDGRVVGDDVWELVIPVEFVIQLVQECLKNYLVFCEKEQREPFSNNKFERKFRIAWYD